MRHYNPYTTLLLMFTGIISSVGRVKKLGKKDNIFVLEIGDFDKLDNPVVGSSIAVNGACLTVVRNEKNTLVFELMGETVRKTGFGEFSPGIRVNLEQAMPANGRFEGHLVQGHVDTQARVEDIRDQKDGGKIIRFSLTQPSSFLVEKGSIALNGVSLTIIDVDSIFFTVGIIPYTWKNTNLADVSVGDKVNVEFDVILKYLSGLRES